jgi:hypothetical protein
MMAHEGQAHDESEWWTCQEPQKMLLTLRASDRKRRLFACAYVRRVWHLMPDGYEDWRLAVGKAEEHADGLLTLSEMWDYAILSRLKDEMECGRRWLFHAGTAARAASNWSDAEGHWCHRLERCVGFSAGMAVAASEDAACAAAYHAALPEWTGQDVLYLPDERPDDPAWLAALAAEQERQADLVRDIFPPPAIGRSSLTRDDGTIRRLAEAAYQDRLLPGGELDPVRLGVLADALEEVGADAGLLEHLRGPGPHVRGCQVVDLFTGRE